MKAFTASVSVVFYQWTGTLKRREWNLVVLIGKYEAKVANNKRLSLRYCTVEANYRQTHSASLQQQSFLWICLTFSICLLVLHFMFTLYGVLVIVLGTIYNCCLFVGVTVICLFLTAVCWSRWWVTSSWQTSACPEWVLWTVRSLSGFLCHWWYRL